MPWGFGRRTLVLACFKRYTDPDMKVLDQDNRNPPAPDARIAGEKKKGPAPSRIIIVLAIAVLLAVGLYYAIQWIGLKTAEKGYDDIAAEAVVFDTGSGGSSKPAATLADMAVDWDYLRSINPDIVAWVYMPGTRINYPVVQGETNDTYLHTDVTYNDGFTARGGAIFLEASNSPDMSDAISFIYGHHMDDGSMFACLSTQLEDQAEFDAHHTFYILTPSRNYRCEGYSLFLFPGDEPLVETNFASGEEKEAYLADKIRRSVVDVRDVPDPSGIGKSFGLVTCDYNQSDGRAMLLGLIAEEAVPSNAGGTVKITTEELTDTQRELASRQSPSSPDGAVDGK